MTTKERGYYPFTPISKLGKDWGLTECERCGGEEIEFVKLYRKFNGNVDMIPQDMIAERDEILKDAISSYLFFPNLVDESIMRAWAYIF